MYIATFLDDAVVNGPDHCGGCHQRTGTFTKRCSGCKSTCYCSSRCQTLHWKTHNIFPHFVRHKFLCPLISYWRKKWKKELKERSKSDENDEEKFNSRWENEEYMDEILTDTCRSRFKDFFWSLLRNEANGHGQLQDEKKDHALETSYERIESVD